MWHLQTVVLVVYISLGNVIGAIQTKDPVSNEDSTHALKDTSENRLYFQGPDYTVNLIPLAILIKIIFVIGYVIKYLLDESNEIDTYGSTGTDYGSSHSGNSYESAAQGYNDLSSYEPPASSYDAHSSSNSFVSPGSAYHAPSTNSYSAPSSGYSSPHGSRVDGVKSVMTSALEKLADLGVSGVVKLSTMLSGEDSNGVKEDIKIHDAYGNDITDQVVYLSDQRQGKLEDGPFAKILNSGFQSVRRSYLDTDQVQESLRKRTRNGQPQQVRSDPSNFQGSPSESGNAVQTPYMNMLPSQRLVPKNSQDPYVQDYYYTEGTDEGYNTLDITFKPGPPYDPSLHGFQEFGARTENNIEPDADIRPVDYSSFNPNPKDVTRRPSTIQKILLDQNKDKLPFPTAQSVQAALWSESAGESKATPLYGSKLHHTK